MAKFRNAVEKIGQTLLTMRKIKKEKKSQELVRQTTHMQENQILRQLEKQETEHKYRKNVEQFNEEWEEYLGKRLTLLPQLPKIEKQGGHHDHSHKSHHSKYLFRINDTWVFWWDVCVLILAVVICFMLPVYIAFHPPWGKTKGWHIFEYMVEGIFTLDILFKFNTTLYDSDGNEVFDRMHIGLDYLSESHFWIDLASAIPFNQMISSPIANLIPILKVIRITSLSQIIKKLSVRDETKALIKVCQLVFYIVLYLHMKACIWFYICHGDKAWLPPLLWENPVDLQEKQKEFHEESNYLQQYYVSFYYSVLMLKPNEIAPRSNNETTIGTIMLIIDLIVAANIYGNMALLVKMANRRVIKQQKQIDNANTAMKDMHIPQEIQTQVREFLVLIQTTREQQEELQKFHEMLSPSLTQEVGKAIFSNVLRINPNLKHVFKQKFDDLKTDFTLSMKINQSSVFKKKVQDAIVELVSSQLQVILHQPEDAIFKQYDDSNDMYVIARGECMVNIIDENGKLIANYKALSAKSYFGEISLLYNCKRTATVISRKYTTLAKLTKAKFNHILTEFPKLKEVLKGGLYKYQDRMKHFIKQSFNKVEYLADLPEEVFHDIVYNMDVQHYQEGTYLQKPGDMANSLFIIQHGVIQVIALIDCQEFIIDRLESGSIINYRTWFMEDKASVFLKFETPSIIRELTLKKMNKICLDHPYDLEEIFLRFQNDNTMSYPLDYLVHSPFSKKTGDYINSLLGKNKKENAARLINLKKNVVMKCIMEYKKRPGLKQTLMLTLQQKAEQDEVKREQLKQKVIETYEKEISGVLSQQDKRFTKILIQINRLHKILGAQQEQVQTLERKILKQPSRQGSMTNLLAVKKGNASNIPSLEGSKDFSNFIQDNNILENFNKSRSIQHQAEIYQDFFQTQRLSKFPRVKDDNFSESSEGERLQEEKLEEISKAAVQYNEFNMSLDYYKGNTINAKNSTKNIGLIQISDEEEKLSDIEDKLRSI